MPNQYELVVDPDLDAFHTKCGCGCEQLVWVKKDQLYVDDTCRACGFPRKFRLKKEVLIVDGKPDL